MYYCTCDWMFVCDYVLIYVLHVSVLVYCPTYCGGCLMRGRGCLLKGQHLIAWARLYRVLLFVDASKLNTILGAVGTFNTRKSMFQPDRKTFSFLNYVNTNSFQSYSLSTFILFVFLFLGFKYNGPKISMKFFVWFLFLVGFSLNTSFWLQILLVLLSGDVEINPSL